MFTTKLRPKYIIAELKISLCKLGYPLGWVLRFAFLGEEVFGPNLDHCGAVDHN